MSVRSFLAYTLAVKFSTSNPLDILPSISISNQLLQAGKRSQSHRFPYHLTFRSLHFSTNTTQTLVTLIVSGDGGLARATGGHSFEP